MTRCVRRASVSNACQTRHPSADTDLRAGVFCWKPAPPLWLHPHPFPAHRRGRAPPRQASRIRSAVSGARVGSPCRALPPQITVVSYTHLAGEFLRLLRELAPDEEKFYAEGAKEVEGEIGKMKQRTPWQLLSSEAAQPRLELNSSRTVSYTHLDVYKRQARIRVSGAITSRFGASTAPRRTGVKSVGVFMMLFIASIPSGSHVARRGYNRAPTKTRMVVVSRMTA